MRTSYRRKPAYYVSGWRPFALLALVGLVVIIRTLYIRRNKGPISGMTYGLGLSTLFVTLGLLSYFAALGQAASVLLAHEVNLGDSLAALALICGMWLLKGEVQDVPTKALRFGAPFSIVFTLLTFGLFIGLRSVLAAAGG